MITVKWQDKGFDEALRGYAATIKKDSDKIVNEAAKHLAFRAAELTRHAEKAQIENLKQVVAVEVFGKSGRRLKDYRTLSKSQRERRTTYAATPHAFLIYLRQQWKAGGNPTRDGGSRGQLETAALRMVNARIASIHFLRSGWLAAGNYFRLTSSSMRKPNIGRKRQGYGGASISIGGRAQAVIWNSSLTNKGGKEAGGLMRYAKEGLQSASDYCRQKLVEITKERLRNAALGFKNTRRR